MKNNRDSFYHKSSRKKVATTCWQDLTGSALGLAIASINIPSPLIVITPNILTAQRLERELRFFIDEKQTRSKILNFPDWETLPYDHFSPNDDLISQRLSSLYQLSILKTAVIFIAASTLMHPLPPKHYLESNSLVLAINDHLDFYLLRHKLEQYGYAHVTKVMGPGEFAIRGSIIDLFAMGSRHPFRIDLLDAVVDSIRVFAVDTQRSFKTVNNIKLLPAREFPLTNETIELFRQSWLAYFGENSHQSALYQSVISKTPHPGVEYYLPLFFKNTATLFDYLPANTVVMTIGEVGKSMEEFWREITHRYEELRHDQLRPILSPEDFFISQDRINRIKNGYSQIIVNDYKHQATIYNNPIIDCFEIQKCDEILVGDDPKNKVLNLQQLLKTKPNMRILLVAESIGRRETLLEIFNQIDMLPTILNSWQEFLESTANLAITIAKIEQPLNLIATDNSTEILLITENQIFDNQPVYLGDNSTILLPQKIAAIISDLSALQTGSPMVHVDYGIGLYLGLQKLSTNGYESEFMLLEYANQAKLYLPITSCGLISRYNGVDSEHPPLSYLGAKQWEKIKQDANKKIRDTAVEILELHARRLKAPGYSYTKPDADYERFASSFPFMVTPDQKRAIEEVIADMSSSLPMDRLICGDVGFGKTEVAMRAAFIAAYNGKQVAILTPTTLLAQQHFNNFKDRFASWPVKIEIISRFRNAKEQKSISENLANGTIDIVIGTHKLLQKNIKFKNLGLLIIDEEHRFGVSQKEDLKKLTIDISILTLTATPIPRTLNMAFTGIRDFSIIATPPAKRLTIKTFIHEQEPYLIREAILRETLRGGQVYFLHNEIATIEKTARELQNLVPTIRLAVAHGQMKKQRLEQIMRDFYHLHTNVLLCTTIIESGIDIPTANTIIIDRADRFGLAELHQLRGRVGRSHHQAYAYLLTPPKPLLTKDAKKRLDAIVAMKDLGTGFILATNDLEIRGAGELLGEKQSGVMQNIGFALYMEMLEAALKTLKNPQDSEGATTATINPELDLQLSALIPDQYINDVNLRLGLYKRIAAATDQNKLDALQLEMVDRFGLLPEYTKNLFKISSLKLKAQKIAIVKIAFGINKGRIEFAHNHSIDPKTIMQLIDKHTNSYKFLDSYTLEFTWDLKVNKLDFVTNFLSDALNFAI